MSYSPDMPAAARRHFEAAQTLAASRRRDVAGYLYGIAVECAIKAMMLDAGLRPNPPGTRDDPFFAHFPELRTMLRDTLQGRVAAPLSQFLGDDRLMNNWSTRMRYSNGREVLDAWVTAWEEQARQAIACIGT